MLASAPQLLDRPIGDFVNSLPWGFFLAVHIALFVVGATFAARRLGVGDRLAGTGFTLFAVAELLYMTYHVNITQFLFAHTLAEVVDAGAFVALFAALAVRTREPARAEAGREVGALR